uniref:Uncharacterized protein n=1 Tax=Otolemur garnettii TaxID=30611 RepID=H0XS16_OTOGA
EDKPVDKPTSLLKLAGQSLLRDEALATAALEELPRELFPPLFTTAFFGRLSETLKAKVRASSFPCLPLGVLMKEQQPHQKTFWAVLDRLLAQELPPRRWKLQVLDLRSILWTVWCGTRASVCSLLDAEAAQPMRKKQKMEPLAPVEVLIDLALGEGTQDQLLTYLIEKVKQRKGLLQLCCRKLEIFAMPIHNIKMILNLVQLDSIKDLEVNCTWKLSTLGKFSPHLGQMSNLQRLLLSHVHMSSSMSLEEEEQNVAQFTSQFLKLHHLQLYLDSVTFFKGHLHQVLTFLKSPLETLSVSNCLLSEPDFTCLSQCPNISQLKDLCLRGVYLTNISPEPFQVLLEDLDLDECGIMDSSSSSFLSWACSQLMTFSFWGNPISMAILENVLDTTI